MGAMRELQPIIGAFTIFNILLGPEILSYRQSCIAVSCQLIPETLDAVIGRRRIIKSRVGQVKTNVLNTHDNSFSRISLRKIDAGIDWQCVDMHGG